MAKKKRSQILSWCWYCDRTFQDDKVLLMHQRSKHFKCPHCPRRLNTAGGLGVHIDQVHKLGTDKIENALPGRDSFDIEIYGMEGIPASDLAEWKKRQAEKEGAPPPDNRPKRPKFSNVPLTEAELKVQLAAHKALMSGQPIALPPPPMPMPSMQNMQGFMQPPGGYAGPPPMGFGMPPGQPPFSGPPPSSMPPPPAGFMAPPPGFVPPPFAGGPLPMGVPTPPPGMSLPPGMPLPPGMLLPPPNFNPNFPLPPPGMSLPPGMPPPPGFIPPPPGLSPLPGPAVLPNSPSFAAVTPEAPVKIIEAMPNSSVTLKPGTLLVYGDNDVSPEEKRANLAQYKLDEAGVISESTSGDVDSDSVVGGNSRKRTRAADLI